MKVVTVINQTNNLNFNLLRLSCSLNKLQLVVLVSNKSNFFSRRIKDDLLDAYLEEQDGDELIFFTDGNDAFLMAQEKEIIEKFNVFKEDLVFSTETSCWPDRNLAIDYPKGIKSRYKFLNSGGFIGKVGLIRNLLKDTNFDLHNFEESNQYLWTKRFLKYPRLIALDYTCELFCTFSPEVGEEYLQPNANSSSYAYYNFMKKWFNDNFQIRDGRIFNSITNTSPCQVHFNGFSKQLIDAEIIGMIYSRIENYPEVQFYYEED